MVGRDGNWRRELRRELVLLMTLKLATLLLLWALFFSSANRPALGARAVERVFGPVPVSQSRWRDARPPTDAQTAGTASAAREPRND